MVNLTEVAVLLQVLLGLVVGVDVGMAVVVVGLAMNEALQGQAVGEGGLFGRPADGEGGDGHNKAGQLEGVDNLLGLIDGGAEVAVAQSFFVHQVAERLCVEQCIDGCILEGEEVVVAWLSVALFTPAGGAMEIGTDGEHHGSLCHHGLVEVGWSQALLHLTVAGNDDAVELQVAHGLCATGLREEAVEERFANFALAILTDCSPCQQIFHVAKVRKNTEMGNFLVKLMGKVDRKWKLIRNFELRSKLLSLRKSKENFDFRSLIRNFASDKRL